MKKMIRKIMILAGIYFILILVVNSCDYGFCKDVEYYDFSEVQIQIENSNTIELQDSLIFNINQLDTRYMAQMRSKFNIIKSTYALNCDYGSLGMKIPLTKIEITSNSDFNQEHPANTPLNDLVIVKILEDPNKFNSDYHFEKFDSVEFDKLLPRVENFNPDLYIVEHPTIESTHRLKIKIFKSNGEIIMAESAEIHWN
ncbi:MAG: hypothetical protein DRJ05_06610 [Bacteroidetes bacterium]|nr:MAG: hypothetical protein DRJ05_06610 [Bacteroidota bacterium]